MTAPCPAYPWCTRTGTHARLHTAVVTAPAPGAPSAQQVELARSGAGQATHIVLSTPVRRGSTAVRRGQTALLTPTAARASARAAQRAGDSTLAAALVRAADLAEGGGHAAGALSDAQLDGIACVRCGATEGPMVPAGHGPRGQLFECTRHRRAGGEA